MTAKGSEGFATVAATQRTHAHTTRPPPGTRK